MGDHLQNQSINNILSAIGLNERYLYSNELFNGELEEFNKELNHLNDFENPDEAKIYFKEKLTQQYNWEESNEMVIALYSLLERRYL